MSELEFKKTTEENAQVGTLLRKWEDQDFVVLTVMEYGFSAEVVLRRNHLLELKKQIDEAYKLIDV